MRYEVLVCDICTKRVTSEDSATYDVAVRSWPRVIVSAGIARHHDVIPYECEQDRPLVCSVECLKHHLRTLADKIEQWQPLTYTKDKA